MIQLWVVVADRGEVDALRRVEVSATVVAMAGGSPLFGRPGEHVCIRFQPSPAASSARRAVAAMPVRAGCLVPGDLAGLAFLDLLRSSGRSPLAASASSVDEARQAVGHGANALVVEPVHVQAVGSVVPDTPLIADVATVADAEAALRAGAHGLMVPAGLVAGLLGSAMVAARLPRTGRAAPLAGSFRPAPPLATIGASLESAARRFATSDALVDVGGGRLWSYEELRADVRRIARALMAHGVGPGDRVALWARNVPEWPLAQLAISAIGAIVVTANPSASAEELRFVLGQSRSRVLLAGPHSDTGVAEIAGIAGARSGALEHIVVLPGRPSESGMTDPSIVSWNGFLRGGENVPDRELDRRMARVRPDDAASILYTSGTTGQPKGATLSHRGMLQNAGAVGANLRLGESDRLCLAVPFHHCFGSVMGTLATVSFGAALVLPAPWFDAAATLAAVAGERCTVLYGVPTMYVAELDQLGRERVDVSSLRTGIVSGAPVPFELAMRISRDLHLPQLVVAYGLTEASPVVTQTRIDDPLEVRLGTAGRPIVGAEVRAVHPDTGAQVPTGQTGELLTRGPMVMRGYFDDPEATAAAIDADGWLHSGDLAVRDERGNWQIVGRLKDMIIRGGENIYPAEVEAVARRHPDVADAHVVGAPSAYFGEEVVAFVRRAAGSSLTSDSLLGYFREHLAHFKVPKEVRFVEAFPMTGSGKVLKTRLRELAAAPSLLGGTPEARIASWDDGSARPSSNARSLPIGLPLLAPKAMAMEDATTRAASAANIHVSVATPPGAHAPPGPRAGWTRPDPARWVWADKAEPRAEDGAVTTEVRRRGQRIKSWGIGENVEAQIEATGEAPIMYKALGTPVRTAHPFNLYGDIRSQPEALRGTFEAGAEIDRVARRLVDRDITGIVGLGSGTSQFVAQVANAAFSRLAGIPAWDYDSMAFLRYPPPFDWTRTVAIGYSGSGSTVDTVAATGQCHDAGAFTVAFTSVEGSPIVQASDARILTSGGFDTGGSDTFHYTTRIAAAIYLALELGRLRQPGAFDYEGLKAQLIATASQMAEMFDAVDARCQTIAEQYLGVRSILVVGGGPNYGTAEEIALKFDEMAHIPTKAMSPGRHIHGALGLTDEDILTILVAPPGTSYADLRQIAKVTQILKTPSVAIVSDDDDEISEMVDYVIRLPVRDELIFPVLAVLPGQLIPYWSSVGLGLNPDTQRSNVPKHARAWHMLFPPGTH